jgi:hypothetical protein
MAPVRLWAFCDGCASASCGEKPLSALRSDSRVAGDTVLRTSLSLGITALCGQPHPFTLQYRSDYHWRSTHFYIRRRGWRGHRDHALRRALVNFSGDHTPLAQQGRLWTHPAEMRLALVSRFLATAIAPLGCGDDRGDLPGHRSNQPPRSQLTMQKLDCLSPRHVFGTAMRASTGWPRAVGLINQLTTRFNIIFTVISRKTNASRFATGRALPSRSFP